jgi:hypothetical protein
MKMIKGLALVLAVAVAVLAGFVALSHKMYARATPVATAPIVKKVVVAPPAPVQHYRGKSRPMVAHPDYKNPTAREKLIGQYRGWFQAGYDKCLPGRTEFADQMGLSGGGHSLAGWFLTYGIEPNDPTMYGTMTRGGCAAALTNTGIPAILQTKKG